MKKILVLLSLALVLIGCSSQPKDSDDHFNQIKVVTSFSIIEDMVHEIGQDKVHVTNLVPSGTDPHEYEPKPADIQAASDADVLIYNGLNLEGGETGWFSKLVKSVGKKPEQVFELSEKIEPMYLMDGDDDQQINPHAFLNPNNGVKMAESTRDALISLDPENKDFYEKNATAYIDQLKALDQKYRDEIGKIDEKHRILVTSERAFQYMNAEYGLREAYIWAIDTEELGTTEQLKSLINILEDEKPPYLFLESNVDPRPMETVSKETGIPIYEKRVYSDEIGTPGTEVDTYIKLLESNLKYIVAGLSS